MGSVLMEMGVCRPLVDGCHGDGSLQLVEFRRSHRVEFLAAHQSVLRQCEQVVTPHAVGVRLGVEIVSEGRWEEVREPCRLIRPLFADEHEDDVIHHRLIEPSRHHGDEPFPEVLVEEGGGAVLEGDGVGKLLKIVGFIGNFAQALQIFPEGMEGRHIVALDDAEDVLREDTLRLRHLAPQRVDDAVGDGLPAVVRLLVFHSSRDDVMAQLDMLRQERLYLLHRGERQSVVAIGRARGVGSLTSASKLFRLLVTTLQDGGCVLVLTEGTLCPLLRRL